MAEKEKSIKEELAEEKKNIWIKLTLTETGYELETSIQLPTEYVMSTLDSINKDLFAQHLFNRKDAPWMRKIVGKN